MPLAGVPVMEAMSGGRVIRIGETWSCFTNTFMAKTGRGIGASHQTGWTALVIRLMNDLAWTRSR
jgi:hypothetical protein